MKRSLLVLFGLVLAVVWAFPLAAQDSRELLIAEAQNEVDDDRALALFVSAMDPALGATDSLWAAAGFDLSDRLVQASQDSLAEVWLRWLARHGQEWPIDRDYYDPDLVARYDRAVEEVGRIPEEASNLTTWLWPQAYDGSSPGFVEATAYGQPATVSMRVEGQEPVQGIPSAGLPPGTYTFLVSAEDHEPAEFVREVLPGFTTVLEVDLVPVLPNAVRDGAAEGLVRITFAMGGREMCANGVLTGRDGLVLTSLSAVGRGVPLGVSGYGDQQVYSDVSILATDPERNLAVLQIQGRRQVNPPITMSATRGQYVWSIYSPECEGLASARTQLANWPSTPNTPARLESPLPPGATGSPLIDRAGSFLGLVTEPSTVVPFSNTEEVLALARQELSALARQEVGERAQEDLAAQLTPSKGFPWKWVGVGMAAAGVAFAVTQGSGGGGGTGDPPPTTGEIRITFPGGG